VEDRCAGLRLYAPHERVLPQPVQAGGHRVVHHVVLRRDAGEDLANAARLLFRADGFVAEGHLFAHAPPSSRRVPRAPASCPPVMALRTMPARMKAMPAKWYGWSRSPKSAAERNAPNNGISVIACPARAGPTTPAAWL